MPNVTVNKNDIFTSQVDLNLMKKLGQYCIWSTASYDAETWTFFLESSEMWCWRQYCVELMRKGTSYMQ